MHDPCTLRVILPALCSTAQTICKRYLAHRDVSRSLSDLKSSPSSSRTPTLLAVIVCDDGKFRVPALPDHLSIACATGSNWRSGHERHDNLG